MSEIRIHFKLILTSGNHHFEDVKIYARFVTVGRELFEAASMELCNNFPGMIVFILL